MWPRTTWPFSSFTRNVALGSVSRISPCICIVSSLAIKPCRSRSGPVHFPSPAGGRGGRGEGSPSGQSPLEIRLLEQALVLLRHHVRLHLRHEVHRHDHD